MQTTQTAKRTPSLLRMAIAATVLCAAAYILYRNRQTVSHSLHVAAHAQVGWTAAAVVLMAVTFLLAAGIYGALALHSLRYWQTVLIEVSTAFVNRLLPSGLGGLGLHGLYLYRRKHTTPEATTIVSINNLLGMGAHLLLLALVIIFQPYVLGRFTRGHHMASLWVILAVLGIIGVILLVPVLRRKLSRFARSVGTSLRRIPARHLLRALALALLLTATYTVILFSAGRAVGVTIGIVPTFIVFSIGMLASSATPTPGGLVGAEAGLFAGFVSYGVPGASAGAAVVIYRLVTYWLPLVPGLLALAAARKQRLV